MEKPAEAAISVLPQAVSDALQADLSAQYDRDEMDRWLSKGGTPPRNGTAVLPSRWTALTDAVGVFTRQMKMYGYAP